MARPVFRFAPSPNGYLHLGHALSALMNFDMARAAGGRLLLRIEDIDAARCRPEYEQAIYQDLAWLGISWEEPVLRQSTQFDAYRAALARLEAAGLIYPSFESRGEIARLIAERGTPENWPRDPDGAPLYPGRGRMLSPAERERRIAAGAPYALRLDMSAAMARVGPLTWTETGPAGAGGTVAAEPQMWGDVVFGAQRCADQLSPRRGRGRRAPRRDPRRARTGSVLVDRHPPVAASLVGSPGAAVPPSPPDLRRERAKAFEIDARHRAALAARRRRQRSRDPRDGRVDVSCALVC